MVSDRIIETLGSHRSWNRWKGEVVKKKKKKIKSMILAFLKAFFLVKEF